MRKMSILIAALSVTIIAGCSSSSNTKPAVTTPGPKCKNNVCVRAVMATTDAGYLAVRFVLTDQDGKVDAFRPPRFDDANLSFELIHVESAGAEKSISRSQRAGRDMDCFASDRFQEFKGQLIGVCGFLVPLTTATAPVQAGDKLALLLISCGLGRIADDYLFSHRFAP
jgi:hypothetical protein